MKTFVSRAQTVCSCKLAQARVSSRFSSQGTAWSLGSKDAFHLRGARKNMANSKQAASSRRPMSETHPQATPCGRARTTYARVCANGNSFHKPCLSPSKSFSCCLFRRGVQLMNCLSLCGDEFSRPHPCLHSQQCQNAELLVESKRMTRG